MNNQPNPIDKYENITAETAKILKILRIAKGMTTADLARITDIDEDYIRAYEDDCGDIHFEEFLILCDALGASASAILDYFRGL